MNYSEVKKDLFIVDKSYHLAHCIASDLGMGAGIAVPMQKKFGIRNQIKNSGIPTHAPTCIKTGRVFNLITKGKSSGKPTYETLFMSLEDMKKQMLAEGINKVAMPKIGCGLDRLSWGYVREMIQDLFKDEDIEILVCVWP